MVREVATREPSVYLRRRAQRPALVEDAPNSLYAEDFHQTIQRVNIDDLIPYKMQARVHFDPEALETLAETIRKHGIRQPLTVMPTGDGRGLYEVISGERRLRAAKMAGLTRVPCIILHDERQAREIALIENLQREDLHPIEEGRAYQMLLEENIFEDQASVAQALGVPKSQISERLKLAKMPEEVAEALIQNKISKRQDLRRVVSCDSPEAMTQVIHQLMATAPQVLHEPPKRRSATRLIEIKVLGDQVEVRRGDLQMLNREVAKTLAGMLQRLASELLPKED